MRIIEAGLFWVSVEETLKPSWIWSYTHERLVPLTHVHAEAVLVETTSEVKITQKYINRQSFPIEAIYVFPLDEHAAVCEFEAEIQGKKVTGVVKPKEQAQIEYNQAIRRGDGAYLLEQAKPDIFRAKVGNIPPGVEVSITIKYVAEMRNELEKVRFLLPTYVAPRYTPAHTPASQVAPSAVFGPSYFAPYQLSVNVTAVTAAAGGFSAIESPSHPITTTITGNVASIGLDRGVTDLTKDFLLMVTYANPHEPKVVLEEDGRGSYAAMITLFPHLEFNDSKTELIFVVDRSGSMESKVKELREALQLFVRSLPEGCYFNIVGFGSSFTKLFPTSRLYNDETLNLATRHISTLNADLGGTELFRPLSDVLKGKGIPGYSRQVFVLTDGQISNTEQVISLVQQNNKESRLFALGIGDSVSHHLVEGLARAGKGTSFFVMENERMEKKIMKQLKDATQPALNDVKVNWGVNTGKPAGGEAVGTKVLSLLNYVSPTVTEKPSVLHQAPFNVPPIFSDSHFRVYSIFETSKLPEKVLIEAMSPDGLLRVELPVDSGKILKGNLIHTLAARAMIRDLEEGSSYLHAKGASPSAVNVRDEVIRLGTKYSLASKHTSFLAIEERSPQEKWFNCYAPPPVPVPVPMPVSSAPRRPMMAMSKSAAAPAFYGAPAPPPPSVAFMSFAAAPPPGVSYQSFSAAPPPPPSGGGPAPPMARKKMESRAMKESSASHFDAEFVTESLLMDECEETSEGYADNFAGFTYTASAVPTSRPMQTSMPLMPQQQAQSINTPSDPYTLMGNLLSLQNTQGAFTYSAQLASAVGLSVNAIAPLLSSLAALIQIQDNGVRERVWATVLALTFLKNKLGSLSDEWELVDKKARKWLSSQGVAQLDDIFAAASGFIQ